MRTALLFVAVLAACGKNQNAAPPPPPAPKVAPPDLAHPAACEVEAMGTVRLPPKPPKGHAAAIYIADGDCLAADVHMLGRVEARDDGGFFIEVFPAWGADLTLCAALEEKPGAPTAFWGKIDRTFHAEEAGEIMLTDLVIEIAKHDKRSFVQPKGG